MSTDTMDRISAPQMRKRIASPVLQQLGQVSQLIAQSLRNPVTGIISTAQILRQQTDADDPCAEGHAFILQEAAKLARTLNNLTSLSPSRRAGSLPSLLSEEAEAALKRIGEAASQQGVHVDFHAEPDMPPALVDSALLQIALNNVLTNALEAMKEGGRLTVEVRCLREFESIEIAIQDTGEGVPADQLNLVFEPLFSTKSDGLGLGLTVARHLVEQQRGRVLFESRPGIGSAVYLRLPISEDPVHNSASTTEARARR